MDFKLFKRVSSDLRCPWIFLGLSLLMQLGLNGEQPTVVVLRLASSPDKAMSGDGDRPVEMSSLRASQFRLVPGLSDSNAVSLELEGANGFFLRHENGRAKIHKRPLGTERLFDSDATWKITLMAYNRIRLESVNYPGEFLAAKSGMVEKLPSPSMGNSIFVMRDK